ncbi:amidohydrolase family protein [Paradevosia shaoguanensis]|uniref:Amidohydrolase n=1 Tax=Paradevosia shaoguanensis TaxID=1335043 RepID=A0AA41QSC2_9HYPH|nr:amidohydrolase [Paradevosia shaoguanensis]MCF1744969.1 amidohydrolase [Paradevosia shaoguanensis]MCI0129452.1 amidohydrolase [Paradevosia shaoguanensis]
MRILDTHLHLVYQDRFSYPWLANAGPLNKQWDAESYFAEAEKLGIESAIHMEVDVAEKDIAAETAFVTQAHPRVIGAVASGRPEHEGFAEYLETLVRNPKVRGLRRILHEAPNELSQTELFAENLRRLAPYHLSFDLCLRADQLPIGADLADKAPDVHFVLDHCGVPKVAAMELEPWRHYIKELAKRPNINAKISGIVAYAKPDWTVDDLRPFAEHVIESFGWDRVVWGSDHPVCTLTANLTRWVEATNQILSGASETEKAKLLHRNAERIYRV